MTAFYLAYHGRDDLELQCTIARVALKATPSLQGGLSAQALAERSPIAGRRVHVGIVSNLFREHTIGHLNIGLIQQLARQQFEVMLFVFSPPKDSFAEKIYAAADRVVRLTGHLERARERILAEQIDVLFYPDIGMDRPPLSWRFPGWPRCNASPGDIRSRREFRRSIIFFRTSTWNRREPSRTIASGSCG